MPINTPPVQSADPPEEDTTTLQDDVAIQVNVVPSLPGIPDNIDPTAIGYLGWGITVTFDWDDGLRPHVPAAVKGTAMEFLRIHAGGCIMSMHAIALRIAQKPSMPSMAAQSNNEVRLYRRVVLFHPANLPDGTPVFGLIAEAIFGLQQTFDDDDDLAFPNNVFLPGQASQYVLNPSDYYSWLRTARTPSRFSGSAITY